MAEPSPGRAPSRRHRLAGVRVRTTLAATLVVALVLVLSGVGFVLLQRHQLRETVADAADSQAADIARQVETLGLSSRALKELVHAERNIVQVVDPSGDVVVSSDPIEESDPVVPSRPAPGQTAATEVDGLPEENDDSYLVLARGVGTSEGDATVIVAESLESADEATEVVVQLLAFGLPVVVLAVAAIAFWMTGRALAPVSAMRRRLGEITARDRSARVPVSPAGDEITRLAETMNAMLERLQSASSRQRRFVADASHELRSPLAAIRTSQEIGLAHPERTDWPQTGRDTLVELERLERLVADLLLLARFDENDPGPVGTDVDLDDIVGAEVARLQRSGHWSVRSVVEPVRVQGDPHQLSRLLRNLVDNATHHARSTIELRLCADGRDAVLEVVDDGPGIRAADSEQIFERFVRLDESRERATGSTGLGLAIAREIARRHGGDVRLADPHTGAGAPPGARFVVRLPRVRSEHGLGDRAPRL